MPWVQAAALMAQWPGAVKADLGNLGGEEEVSERGHKQDHYDSDYSAHMHY